MKDNVIIIGGGNHHNALGVIRAIGRCGYSIELITIGNLKKNYIASSIFVNVHHALANIKELPDFLISRDKSNNKEIIISCSDAVTECLNMCLEQLIERYVVPGVAKQGQMSELMDKTMMIKMAAKRGLQSPKIWKWPMEMKNITFPCITKSYVSSHGGKSDIVICKNKEELDAFFYENNDEIFVQEYVDKKEEVQFIGCSLYGGEEIIIPGMTRILRSQSNTNTGFLEYGPVDPFYEEIVNKSKAYIKDCSYSGLFSIEFIRDKNNIVYFLEVNFRNDGNAYCVTESGVNLPIIWVKSNLNENYMEELKEPQHILVMPEFQDFKLVLQRKLSWLQWINDLKKTDTFLEYAKDDKKPFFQFLINKFKFL